VDNIKKVLSDVIERDRINYENDIKILNKLDWVEKYLKTKCSHLKEGVVPIYSGIVKENYSMEDNELSTNSKIDLKKAKENIFEYLQKNENEKNKENNELLREILEKID